MEYACSTVFQRVLIIYHKALWIVMTVTDSYTECEEHVSRQGRKRLLFVDDDTTILEGYRFIFEDEGFRVDLASSQTELLKLLEKKSFDIIVLDYHIGDVKGIKLAEKIQQAARGVKIIFISGQKNAVEEILHSDVEIAGFFLKPLKVEELLEYVSANLVDS